MRALGIVMYLLKNSLGSWLPGRNKMFGSSTIKECFKTSVIVKDFYEGICTLFLFSSSDQLLSSFKVE